MAKKVRNVMNTFDQYILNEIVSEYEKSNLSDVDYEELYLRFNNVDYLDEVKPYLFVMRFFGLGTSADKEAVLKELEKLKGESTALKGIYFDLLLGINPKDLNAVKELYGLIKEGYSNKYLKEHSNINLALKIAEEEKETLFPEVKQIQIEQIDFVSTKYSGYYFTSGDIDYLNARVSFKPMKVARKINVRSQLFVGNEPFSQIFYDDFQLNPGDTWFRTTGWGNETFNCYSRGIYQWRIVIDGKEAYNQDFIFYNGKIDQAGIPVKKIKLFASKASGALENDWDNYTETFDSKTLECVYFSLLFTPLGQEKNIQVKVKVNYLEDGSEIYNDTILFHIEPDWDRAWTGVYMRDNQEWKKGSYKYEVQIGTGKVFNGQFTVF